MRSINHEVDFELREKNGANLIANFDLKFCKTKEKERITLAVAFPYLK